MTQREWRSPRRWSPRTRRRVALVIWTAVIIVVVFCFTVKVAVRLQGEKDRSELAWFITVPIVLFGIGPLMRNVRRGLDIVMEWPAWRTNRNESPEARVFRGHPDMRFETLHEARARRFQDAQDRATAYWRERVRAAALEIYGDEGPPENPETPEWLKIDASAR